MKYATFEQRATVASEYLEVIAEIVKGTDIQLVSRGPLSVVAKDLPDTSELDFVALTVLDIFPEGVVYFEAFYHYKDAAQNAIFNFSVEDEYEFIEFVTPLLFGTNEDFNEAYEDFE